MEGKKHTFKIKTILGIALIVLLAIFAITSIVVFLKDRGTSDALDNNQTEQIEKNEDSDKNDSDRDNEQNSNESNKQENEQQNNNINNNNNNTNNNTNSNNNVANRDNNKTGTEKNVNEIGETAVERVEEREKIVSKEYWDWWKPTNIYVDSVSTDIVPVLPNIMVTKISETKAGNKLVYAGEKITYILKVKNNGNKDVEKIEVMDKIPSNTTFESVENDGITIKSSNDSEKIVGVKWIITVKAGEEVSLKFTVVVDSEVTGTITNKAIANGEDSNEENTSIITNSKTSEILRYNKETNKYEKVSIAKVGDEIKYTISVTNTGTENGTTTISDNIPTGTILKRGTVDGAEISKNRETLTWKDVTVPAGETIQKTFTVIVKDIKALENKKITNIATVGNKDTDKTEDPTTGINVEKTVIDILRDDESLGLDTEVKEGDVIKYKITVTNTGSENLTNVVVDEKLEGIELDEFELNIGNLNAGESKEIFASYTVSYEKDIKENVGKLVHNEVKVTGETNPTDPDKEPEKVEDKDEIDTPVADAPSVDISKVATRVKENGSEEFVPVTEKTMVRPGDVIEYVITVTNTGNVTLENIKVTDSLKVTVNGEIKDVDENGTSIIAEIKELSAETGKNVETITTYYTVVESDVVEEKTIMNTATVIIPDVPGKDSTEEVPVNPDTSVSGTKTWIDGGKVHDNAKEITLVLTRKSEKIESAEETVVATPTWNENTYTFSKLPKYDAEGYLYTYKVTENVVSGYTTEQDGKDIINIMSNINETTSVTGTKTWIDGGKTHNNTTEIKLVLTRTSAKAGSVEETVVATPTWDGNTYKFSGLAKYDAEGYLYTYKVSETQVNGYDAPAYDSNNPNNITNTITDPMNIVVSGTKTWIDSNNAYGTRPDSIKVNLLQNGTKIKDATVKADKDGKWTYEFTGLAKYDAKGYEYTYTVTEDTVEGYTTLPIVKDTSTGKYNITNTLTLGITKSATDAAGNEITELTYDSNTPSSNNFNYVLTVTSQEKLEIPQTVTDILPTGITVAEEWERPSNVTVTTDAETGKQTITWTVDLSESTTTTLTIPVVADESLFSGKETEEETVISVLDLKFENKGTTYTGSKNSNSKGLNIFLRALDAANPNSDNGYIYAGNVEASDLVDRSTKFVTGYNDELVNQTLSSNDSNAIKAMLVDIAEDNADTENGLGRYLKNGLPSLTDINTTLTNLYGGNIKISPTQVILWYKVPYSVDETLDRHYTISDENENQLFDGTISLPECAYHIDGIIVDISTLGGYIPKGTTVPVKNRATIGKIYDDATVDITYKPSELTNISVKKEWVDNSAEKPTSVTAQLFADGVEEGEPVVLNAGNSWSYDWTTLYKNKGEEEIEYTVKEIKVGTEDVVGNETSKYISTQEFDEETRTVTIINTRKAEIVSTKTASTENGTITVVQGQQETAGEIPVEIGDTIEYTITVENKGALTEKDVTVQDTNPQHTTPISGSALEVTFNNGTTERKLTATEVQEFINGTFKVDVPAYTIFTFKFSVKVTDGSLTDKITNTAYVGGNPVGPTINSIERTVNVTKYKNNIASTNIILVLDVSSSMNNSRIVDARNAINTFVENTYAIEKNKNVTFTLLTFANRDYTEGKGATKGKPAYSANQKGGIFEFNDDGDYIVTYDNKDEFTNAVSGIVTDSGTNIRAGLEVTEKAIYGEDGNGGIAGMEGYKDYEQIVIFFGDGEPYGETEQLNNETGIKAKADDIRKKGAKIFSIGFGSDVSKPNSTGYKVLSKISDDGKVYTSSNYTDLVRDFSKIVGTDPSYDQITVNGNAIINITSNAQDIIVDADNPIIITVGGESTIITSKADATANHITYTNKQITWDVSSYSESEALTITYYVQ